MHTFKNMHVIYAYYFKTMHAIYVYLKKMHVIRTIFLIVHFLFGFYYDYIMVYF